MKIGILSMQKVENFGSVLQAYSLRKIVKSITGGDCSFIDIMNQPEDQHIIYPITDYSIENGRKSVLKKIDKYALNRLLKYQAYKLQISKIRAFQESILKLSEPSPTFYDICIIGSDEVFNCLQPSAWGYSSQLFGNVKNASKVITYAASCGSTSYAQLTPSLKTSISDSLRNLSSISVRDKNTSEFIFEITQREPIINLDPVVVGNFDTEIEQCDYSWPEKYCILYSYYNRFHNEEEIKTIINFCKRKNLKLVSVFGPQYWVKDYVVLNPFEVLSFFKKAEFVITDTFHGAIFAAKYAKKYGIINRESNKNKLMDLANRLDIFDHVIKNIKDIELAYEKIDDKKRIRELETKELSKTKQYLKQAIVDNT